MKLKKQIEWYLTTDPYEEGHEKEQSSNWLVWLILAILIILAM